VGTHCAGAQGLTKASDVCDGAAGSGPEAVSCAGVQRCIEAALEDIQDEEDRAFFTVYVTIVLFYALTLVEALDFFEEEQELHLQARRVLKAAIAGAILLEAVAICVLLGITEASTISPDLDQGQPLADAMDAVITTVSAMRIVMVVGYFLVYAFADFAPGRNARVGSAPAAADAPQDAPEGGRKPLP